MKTCLSSLLAISVSSSAFALETLPVVSVTADFRDIEILKSATSVSVIDRNTIARRDATHLDQVLNIAPNVNFSTGASRGRFLQVRGVGERSQFKDPLDASVGMTIDGIDYSGLGLASLLFDVDQVEILRGPQGTQFGSAAMAGAVNIRSTRPTADFGGQLSAGVGNYDSHQAGLVVNGALAESVYARLALQKNVSDGYVEDDFLDRENTNNIDEQMAKAQVEWLISDHLSVNFTGHFIDADNGYNAFSLDNSRHIPADDPGHDRQRTEAFAISTRWSGNANVDAEVTLSWEHSDLQYGFDWDWSNLSDGARGSEDNVRDRQARALDMRLISKPGNEILGGAAWVFGLYTSNRDVDLEYSDSWEDILWGGPWTSEFSSHFETSRKAAYGQLDWPLTDTLALTTGIRLERYHNQYNDAVGVDTEQKEDLWGGKLVLSWSGMAHSLLYASVSRGYKIGGVNGQAVGKVLQDPDTPASIANFLLERATFDDETLINYELGLKGRYLDDHLDFALTLFYMDRKDMQANAWVLFPPTEWKSYLDNVDDGYNSGIELEAQWYASDNLTLFTSIGLLDTELGELTVQDVDSGAALDQTGREQAHAPGYQYNLGATLSLNEQLDLTLEVDGKDDFYFSNSHNQKSDSYALLNATLAYRLKKLTISLWGRNLTDRNYQTRGFYFDNTFPDYDGSNNKTYYQLGEPRVIGVSGSYSF